MKGGHTAGTKAFSKIRYDKRNETTQADFDFIDLYEDTHTTDGLWVHENAKKSHESLKEHRSKAEMEGSNLIDEQLSILTFGRKPGHICGLGRGPKPTFYGKLMEEMNSQFAAMQKKVFGTSMVCDRENNVLVT